MSAWSCPELHYVMDDNIKVGKHSGGSCQALQPIPIPFKPIAMLGVGITEGRGWATGRWRVWQECWGSGYEGSITPSQKRSGSLLPHKKLRPSPRCTYIYDTCTALVFLGIYIAKAISHRKDIDIDYLHLHANCSNCGQVGIFKLAIEQQPLVHWILCTLVVSTLKPYCVRTFVLFHLAY